MLLCLLPGLPPGWGIIHAEASHLVTLQNKLDAPGAPFSLHADLTLTNLL